MRHDPSRSAVAPPTAPTLRALARRVFVAMLAALLLVLALPAGSAAALAPPLQATPSPSPETADPTLTLVPLSRGIVQQGQPLAASIVVDNPSDESLPEASATVELADAPVASTEALDVWLTSGVLEGGTQVIDRPVLPAVEAGDSAAAAVSLAADSPLWQGRAPGVYPLRATYPGGLVSRSVIVLQDPAATPAAASIGVIVPITVDPRSQGLLTADELTELTSTEGRLTALVDGVSGTSAILAVDPAILASIRALGTSAPASAREWMLRLDALPNPRFALQFGDADLSVQADAGLTEPLEPTSLDYAVDADDFAADDPDQDEGSGLPDVSPSPTPSPTASPGEQNPVELPDFDELTTVSGAQASVGWPAEGEASAETVATIAAWMSSQEGAAASATLLSSGAVARASVQAGGQTADGARTLVYEQPASAALRDAVQTGDVPRAAPLAALTAHLALLTADATGPVLLTTGRLDSLSGTSLQGALAAVAGSPGVAPASLDDLLQAGPADVTPTGTPNAEGVAALQNLLSTEQRLDEFSIIIDDPALMTAPERTAILQLIGAAWPGDPESWRQALSAHGEQSEATLTAVSIPQPSTIQLITPEAPLRFYVQNDLPWAVTVDLQAVPDNLRLEVERTTSVRSQPGVNTTVQVPVRARVGSGEVLIELRLESASGQQIGPTRYAEVQVRADWEGIGVVVLSTLVVLLLGAGLVRTVLRRRRARRTARNDSGPAQESASEPANDDPHAGDPPRG
ncbi:DUF6049 family protein [Microbacterium sp. HA-8]|uniref:DUF6049 family protein n=1 Tax=Microbacterium sp. HA-8 TaxID=3234200 RepID=UPI0038F77D18